MNYQGTEYAKMHAFKCYGMNILVAFCGKLLWQNPLRHEKEIILTDKDKIIMYISCRQYLAMVIVVGGKTSLSITITLIGLLV